MRPVSIEYHIDDLSRVLLSDIGKLHKDADDYNVNIKIGDDSNYEIFKAHSVILRTRSPYFHAALSNNWAKKDGDIIVFKKPNILPNVFRVILKYIYTGIISLDSEVNLVELLTTADELELLKLVDYIQDHIIGMSREWFQQNLVRVFNTISRHNGVFLQLQEYCTKLITKDPELLFKSNDFCLLDEEALINILQQDNLLMKEIDIWEHLIKWGISRSHQLDPDPSNWTNEDFDTLEKFLHKSIPYIRFFAMSHHNYYYKIRPFKRLLPRELYEDLKLYFIVPNSKPNAKVLPPRIKRYSLDSNIIDSKYVILLSNWIDKKQKDPLLFLNQLQQQEQRDSFQLDHPLPSFDIPTYEFKLLLRGSRDGFAIEEFRKRCFDQSSTIILIKVSGTGHVIGGYNPVKWSGSNQYITSKNSFIFSLYFDLNCAKSVLSRCLDETYAISDGSDQIGWGQGDLHIFEGNCQRKSFSLEILESKNFVMEDYEVFQVVNKII